MISRQKTIRESVTSLRKQLLSKKIVFKKLLTPKEWRYAFSQRHPAEPLAARIAAKKACLALLKVPSAVRKNWFRDIEIVRDSVGRPHLKLSARFKKKWGVGPRASFFVSLAHERDAAIAWLVIFDAKAR